MELRFHERIDAVPAAQWDALAGGQPSADRSTTGQPAMGQPFLRHAFLDALEQAGCVGGETGWAPLHAGLYDGDELVAAMPLYLKQHSWGEYVFDWAWADASERAGLDYYPKLLAAVPFSPVPGPRLPARDAAAARALLDGVLGFARDAGLSGLHCLFPRDGEAAICAAAGMLHRRGVQFHWRNRGYRDYADFLDSLQRDKRKKLRQERRRVADAGVAIVRKTGAAINAEDWAFFVRCYERTYAEHRSTPYLNLDFFLRLGAVLGDQCLLVLASQDGEPIAAALDLFDGERLYGRYWGALRYVPNLHFELCYHQGIEFAIERGLAVFEGGAQGEHKLARGFEAVETHSFHWLAQPALASAVSRYLQREGQGVGHYLDELGERAPFAQAAGSVD